MTFKKNQVVYYLEPNLNTLALGAMQIDSVETDVQHHSVYAGFTAGLYEVYIHKDEAELYSSKDELLDKLQKQLDALRSHH